MINPNAITNVIIESLGEVFPAIQLEVWLGGEPVFSTASGYLDPNTCLDPVRFDTLFDLASVTKLFTTTAFMRLVEKGEVKLDQTVSSVLLGFSGERPIVSPSDPSQTDLLFEHLPGQAAWVNASQVTFRQILAHNSGLSAACDLKDQPDLTTASRLVLQTPFAYPIQKQVLYSDPGFIILGFCVENITGLGLGQAINELICMPLGLIHTRYLQAADSSTAKENIAPTELCPWRKRRIHGEVHDENCTCLGGVAGHAGLFSTARDIARFGQTFLENGVPLLSINTVREMVTLQSQFGVIRRGLGFALWSADPEMSGNPFSYKAYGHDGFTGTSLWIDPMQQLVVACNTNRIYYGRNPEGIRNFRIRLHRAIVEVADH